MLKHGSNEFELEIRENPSHITLTTRHNNKDLYTDCDWGFDLTEWQEFVGWVNQFDKKIRTDSQGGQAART